jgi:hypothetical protein
VNDLRGDRNERQRLRTISALAHHFEVVLMTHWQVPQSTNTPNTSSCPKNAEM